MPPAAPRIPLGMAVFFFAKGFGGGALFLIPWGLMGGFFVAGGHAAWG